MNRRNALALMLSFPVVAVADGKPSEYVKDPNYEPKPGDRVHLFGTTKTGVEIECWCATSESAFREYDKSLDIDDSDGLRKLRESGRVFRLPSRTSILVLSKEDEKTGAVEIRVLEGPSKSRRLWAPVYYVNRITRKR